METSSQTFFLTRIINKVVSADDFWAIVGLNRRLAREAKKKKSCTKMECFINVGH